jgi:predicted Zn-dependent protease with MMP-like domain
VLHGFVNGSVHTIDTFAFTALWWPSNSPLCAQLNYETNFLENWSTHFWMTIKPWQRSQDSTVTRHKVAGRVDVYSPCFRSSLRTVGAATGKWLGAGAGSSESVGTQTKSSDHEVTRLNSCTGGGVEPFCRPDLKANWKHLTALALAEVEAILASLPKPVRERAVKLSVTFERQPNMGLQADGIEIDTLGLFTGPEFAEEGHATLPPQITLFLENIWDFAEENEDTFREEVRTTFLHELGHYLGLDEDELTDRGLE